MEAWPAVDSRDYIVAFELTSTDDCPPDFELPSSAAGFETGLFLPRGERDWFGRPSYPPRVLLLKGGTLHILSHPSTGEPPCQCAMEQISSVETGHMLLKGWLRFTGPGFDFTVRYNTRGFRSVFHFMQRFRNELLGAPLPLGDSRLPLEVGLDRKFANALMLELDSGEAVLTRAFQPPREALSSSWLFPHHHWVSGDLLALTSTRLLWITDRERGSYSRYGSIASYAPFQAVVGIDLRPDRRADIQVNLNDGSAWQIPIALENQHVAEEFAAALEIQNRRNGASRTAVRR